MGVVDDDGPAVAEDEAATADIISQKLSVEDGMRV